MMSSARFVRMGLLGLAGLVASAALSPAFAHGSEAAVVLLLPTGYYLLGAVVAVAASFLLMAFISAARLEQVADMETRLGSWPTMPVVITSCIMFAFMALLIVAGLYGERDPLENPLPSFIWTVWWVCFTLLQGLVGPLWPHLNPWSGPLAIWRRLTGFRAMPAILPDNAGYLLAIVQFAAFAWFELVDIAPSDPARLAVAVSLYWIVNAAGAVVFGEESWMKRAEPFSIFFGLIGRVSPLAYRTKAGRTSMFLVWPGRSLLRLPPLPLSGVLFVLLALSTVSFDGLSRTFLWLSVIGVNPLEFPGRSAVVVSSSIGMAATFAALALAFLGAVLLGCALIGKTADWRVSAGRLIYGIVPISLAFQAAHYLTTILVELQNAMVAMSDPFGLEWDLFGTHHHHVTTSFLNNIHDVTLIFNTQTFAIAFGHIVGVILAHVISSRIFGTTRAAVLSQIPMAALMIFYTGFGLWLLSTPRI